METHGGGGGAVESSEKFNDHQLKIICKFKVASCAKADITTQNYSNK